MQKDTYTSKEIAKELGININTLNLWVKNGLLKPDVFPAGGRGTMRVFSQINVFEAAVAKDLMNQGRSLALTKAIMDFMRKRQLFHYFADIDRPNDEVFHLLAPEEHGDGDFLLISSKIGEDICVPSKGAPSNAVWINLTNWLPDLAFDSIY
jgi:DNA-binding transcriptional MerR regulator